MLVTQSFVLGMDDGKNREPHIKIGSSDWSVETLNRRHKHSVHFKWRTRMAREWTQDTYHPVEGYSIEEARSNYGLGSHLGILIQSAKLKEVSLIEVKS